LIPRSSMALICRKRLQACWTVRLSRFTFGCRPAGKASF
jgi:hypothetical protein